MKTRSKNYLGTFVNSPEGILSYKLMVKTIRQTVTGGRFMKMFRGSPRPYRQYGGSNGVKPFRIYQGSTPKKGATHFDCYLIQTWKDGKFHGPKFYNWELR